MSSIASLPPRAGRKVGFLPLHDLTCPNGHHMKEDGFVLEHGGFRCKHKEPLVQTPEQRRRGQTAGHGPECGAWLYVLACAGWSAPQADGDPAPPASSPERPLMVFAAEVDYRDLREMQRQRLDVNGVLRYLGVRFGTLLAARSAA